MESETIPSEEHKTDSPFGATLFRLPFKEDYRIYVRIFIEICRHTNMYSVIMS